MTKPESRQKVAYDEFALFHENIAEYGLAVSSSPVVSRVGFTLEDGRTISALKWGTAAPRLVLVHGSAQNAQIGRAHV